MTELEAQLAAAAASLAQRQSELAQRQAEMQSVAQQRAGFDAARNEWQADRRSLTEQLAGRDQQLAALQAELEAAVAQLCSREDELTRLAARIESLEAVQATGGFESVLPPEPAAEVVTNHEPDVAPSNPAESPEEAMPIFVRHEAPAGRRSKAQRHEMTSFIGDRLIEMGSSHRRRRLLVWGSVAAGTIALSAAILGVLYLLR